MPIQIFIDSNVPLYALGGQHPLREPCQELLFAIQTGNTLAHASVEMIQEVVFHRMRRDARQNAIGDGRLLARMCDLHTFDQNVLERALWLIETSAIRGRDAIHAATALENGFHQIVTADPDFIAVPGLTPISPEAALNQVGESAHET